MPLLEFSPLTSMACRLGESPVYDDRNDALYFTDIPARAIHRIDLSTRTQRTWPMPGIVASIGLAQSGRLVLAMRDVVTLFDPEAGTLADLARVETEIAETRLNDGKVGPDGAFWVGTMHDVPDRKPIGALYRVAPDGTVEKKVAGIAVSNGLAFSPDGRTLYHSDTRGPWIDAWSLDPSTGAIADRRRLATLDEATGRPDGGAVDAEGCYWSAGISAARLNRFLPDGTLMGRFDLPLAAPTMPCFGGPGLRTLFVTSLREGQPSEALARYPLSGHVLAALCTVPGTPIARFADSAASG